METWIKLYRKLLDNPVATDLELLGFISWCLLKANHKDNDIFFNKKKLNVKRGTFITSTEKIASHFSISRSKAYRLLVTLSEERILKHESTSKYTVVTVLNYSHYQPSETQTETLVKHRRNAGETQKDTNKNEKNEENEKNLDTNVSIVQGANELISLFAPVNPSYKTLYPQKGQRLALERMINEHGREKVERAIKALPAVVGKPYAPTITSPYELEKKMGSLVAYLQKTQGEDYKFAVTKV